MDIKTKLYVTKMCALCWNCVHMLDVNKVLMYESHYDCIKNKYGNNSKLLSTNTDSMKLKLKMFMKILVKIRKCLISVIIQLSQNIMAIKKI